MQSCSPTIEIINTGSELMLGYVLNTHQQWLCRELSERGYVVSRQVAVDDSAPAIREAVSSASGRADLIITTGGLGPTSDDRTREVIADLLGMELEERSEILVHIEDFFARRKRALPASVRVQALVPKGANYLMNAQGTAPGLVIPTARGLLVMLPGPPRELRPMFLQQVLPVIEKQFPRPGGYACCVLRSTGIGESFVEERIADSLAPFLKTGLEVGYCARVGEVDVRLVARGEGASRTIAEAEALVRQHLRSFVYGRDPDNLESVVVRMLTEQGKMMAVAESCTGGYLAHRLTNVPGASVVLAGGWITYSNELKQRALGVEERTLQEKGAVSVEVAGEMALGAQKAAGADYAISITGIAGPGGGTAEKPVGTVFLGLATPKGVLVKKKLNQYDRETFKFVTTQQALDWIRRALLGAEDSE